MKFFKKYFLGIFVIAFVAAGCAQQTENDTQEETQQEMTNYTHAVAHIHAKDDRSGIGTVTFEKVSEGVNVVAEISDLEEGKHGFHIHQYGDCTASDLTSAGGHYNPHGLDHGAPTDTVRHMGDMGNLPANVAGDATLDYVDNVIELNGPNSIIGRAVIIHSGADDFTSQPSGAAGERIACGVIGIAEAEADTVQQ